MKLVTMRVQLRRIAVDPACREAMESLAERGVSGEVSAGEFCVSHGRFRGHSEETGKHARRGVSDHVALCGRAAELALLFPASGRDRDRPPTRTGNQAASLTPGGPLDRGPLLGVSWAYSDILSTERKWHETRDGSPRASTSKPASSTVSRTSRTRLVILPTSRVPL